MMSKIQLSIYLFFCGILVAALAAIWYLTDKNETLVQVNEQQKIEVLAQKQINEQLSEEITSSRAQIEEISSLLAQLNDNVAKIDINTQEQVTNIVSMKDRFDVFLAKPGMTGKLVNKDFSKNIEKFVCISGDKSKCQMH